MKTNIKEIAKITGFSTTTISRYFNHPEKLSEKTGKKIKAVITKYGYVPNELARGLRSKRKNLVAIILKKEHESFLSFPYFSVFSNQVLKTLSGEKIYTITTFEESDKKPHMTYRSFVQKNLVDGFIVMGMAENDKRIKFLLEQNENFVTVGRNPLSDNYTWVDCDNVQGGFLATNHLIKKGCRRILFFGGFLESCDTKMRLQGYRNALEENNIKFRRNYVYPGDFTGMIMRNPEDNFERFADLKTIIINQKIEGVFAVSDVAAIGLIKMLKHMKIKIPVVGFDDVSLARIYEPTLTTVRQPIEKIAEKVATKLIQKINGESPQSEMVKVELIERESSNIS